MQKFEILIALITLFLHASGCGIAPVAQNATCCECAGYTGDQHPCHWCPEPIGGCRYDGSAEYHCPNFVSDRSKCPTPCSPVPPSPPPSPPSPPPPPTPPGPMRPFTKKGVGYYGGNCSDFGILGLSNISWFYDWGHDQGSMERNGCQSTLPNHSVDGVEYVPQIWGKYALKNFSDMNVTFIKGAKYIFGYNEPDHTGSSYLAPLEGAQRWPNMVALAQAFNLTVVAPCVANYASGQWWLSTWNAACKNLTGQPCYFDHMCLHTYFNVSEIGDLFSSLKRMYTDYGKPIWLNEFACPPYKNCSATDQLKFAKIVVPRLEATPYVFRYAWFEARADKGEALLANTPQVQRTPLGDWYNDYNP